MSESANPSASAAASGDTNNDSAAVELCPLVSIWDCPYIKKCQTADGKLGWECKWCGTKFVGQNASKALVHPSKLYMPSAHVQPCKAVVEPAYRDRYRALIQKKANAKAAKAVAKVKMQTELREESRDVGDTVQSRKKSRLSSDIVTGGVISLLHDDRRPNSSSTVSSLSSTLNSRHVSMEAYAKVTCPKSQSTILGSNEAACDDAFAKMVHAKNLPLDFGQD